MVVILTPIVLMVVGIPGSIVPEIGELVPDDSKWLSVWVHPKTSRGSPAVNLPH